MFIPVFATVFASAALRHGASDGTPGTARTAVRP
jgi:hypothetical protein